MIDSGRSVALDLANPRTYATVVVKQYDNADRIIEVTVTDGGAPVVTEGFVFMVEGTRPDGQVFANTATVVGGIVSVTLTEMMTSVPGSYGVDLVMTGENFRRSQRVFKLEIDRSAVQDIAIESSAEYTLLQDMIQQFGESTNAAQTANAAATAANLAANNALAAVAACEGEIHGQNAMVDSATGTAYVLGVYGGNIFIEPYVAE